ncbi:MAG: hypothetical protein SGJ26_15845 [Nitrospirota bacterium]|nr:hypothetical protein [Nitrospirota bacterium]
MVEAFEQRPRKSQLTLVFCMFGGVVYGINEQQELFPAGSSLQCGNRLSEAEPESFDELFHVLVDWQERITQAIARKVVDDVDQAAFRKMPRIIRRSVSAAAKAIEQNGFVNLV